MWVTKLSCLQPEHELLGYCRQPLEREHTARLKACNATASNCYQTHCAGIEIFGKKRSRASIENQEPKVVKQANIAIQTIDEDMGLQRPVIVLGYNCVGRCVSIRSKRRVINYMIAAYSNGKTSADLKQMMMRGAGFTRQVCRQHAFSIPYKVNQAQECTESHPLCLHCFQLLILQLMSAYSNRSVHQQKHCLQCMYAPLIAWAVLTSLFACEQSASICYTSLTCASSCKACSHVSTLMELALQEREKQGYQHIRLTSTAEDWEVLQKLYDLQLKALSLSATGNVEDLDKWCVNFSTSASDPVTFPCLVIHSILLSPDSACAFLQMQCT